MKKTFLKLCYVSNLLLVVMTVAVTISYVLRMEAIYNQLFSLPGTVIRGVLGLMSIILWIYCINIWAKFDKKVSRLFLILFLTSFYIIFYFRRILREGWL